MTKAKIWPFACNTESVQGFAEFLQGTIKTIKIMVSHVRLIVGANAYFRFCSPVARTLQNPVRVHENVLLLCAHVISFPIPVT